MQATCNPANITNSQQQKLNFKSTYRVYHHVLNSKKDVFERVATKSKNKALNDVIISTVNSKSKEQKSGIIALIKILREFFAKNDSCCSVHKTIIRSFNIGDETFYITGAKDCDLFTQKAAKPLGIARKQLNKTKKDYENFLEEYNMQYRHSADTIKKGAATKFLEELLYNFQMAKQNYDDAQKYYYRYGTNYTHNDNFTLKNKLGERLVLCTAFVEEKQPNGEVRYRLYNGQFVPENKVDEFQNLVNSELRN